MDRQLALRSLGTFLLYLFFFKVIEYIIAFMLDDALVELLSGGGLFPRLLSLLLTSIAFILAFKMVMVGKILRDTKLVMLYTLAPFVVLGLIAIGRNPSFDDIFFRALFIVVIYFIADKIYEHERILRTDHPLIGRF